MMPNLGLAFSQPERIAWRAVNYFKILSSKPSGVGKPSTPLRDEKCFETLKESPIISRLMQRSIFQ